MTKRWIQAGVAVGGAILGASAALVVYTPVSVAEEVVPTPTTTATLVPGRLGAARVDGDVPAASTLTPDGKALTILFTGLSVEIDADHEIAVHAVTVSVPLDGVASPVTLTATLNGAAALGCQQDGDPPAPEASAGMPASPAPSPAPAPTGDCRPECWLGITTAGTMLGQWYVPGEHGVATSATTTLPAAARTYPMAVFLMCRRTPLDPAGTFARLEVDAIDLVIERPPPEVTSTARRRR